MARNADEPRHPLELFNENRRLKKKVNSTATVRNASDKWLQYFAQQNGNPAPCKDGCFDQLVDDEIREAVVNFLLWHGEKNNRLIETEFWSTGSMLHVQTEIMR